MKYVVTALAVAVSLTVMGLVGYSVGVRHATTAEGWIDNDRFVLEVDGNIYTWDVSEE